MEQLLFVAALRLVEQPPADAFDKASSEQGAARPPRPSQDRGLDRPHAPFAEMVESGAVGVGHDEAGVAVACGPVERERDLVRGRLHSCWPAGVAAVAGWGCGCGG